MIKHRISVLRAIILAFSVAGFAAPMAVAQVPSPAAQEAAFQRMYAAPTDPQAILGYARLSVALRDFEAAAAALERLVALEPRNTAARQQLALAYYALGSNAMAERQLQAVAEQGGGDPELAAQAQTYAATAAQRRAVSQLSGSYRFGSVFSSDPAARGTDSDLALIWRHDLGSAAGHVWLTTLNATLAFDSGAGAVTNRSRFSLRSGPMFSLGTARQSPRLQPFLMISARRDNQGETIRHRGAGLLLQLPLGDRIALTAERSFGDAEASYSLTEGQFNATALQASFRVSDRTLLRASYDEETRNGFSTGREADETTALELVHSFRPGFSRINRNWRITASFRDSRMNENGAISTSDTRGVTLRAWVTDQTFADISLSRAREVDGLGGPTTTPTRIGLRIGREF